MYVISILLLGMATENTLCTTLESLNICREDFPATKDTEPNMLLFLAHIRCSYLSED